MATAGRKREFRLAPTLGTKVRRFGVLSGQAMRSNPPLLIGVVIIAFITLVALFAHVIVTEEYQRVNPRFGFLAPSADHWFGTDRSGRDVFNRTIIGSRISLYVGFTVTAITVLVGLSVGLIAGYTRLLDNIIMRFVDGMLAFPTILLALAIIAVFGASLNNVILALVVTGTAGKVRLVRGQVLTLREVQFVDAARAIGAPVWRILYLHIAPNTFAVLMVQATFTLAGTILAEASLSYLGVGVPEHIPSWGNIVAGGQGYVQVAFWVSFFPGLFLTLTVLSVVLIGDALRDYMDPKLRGKLY
jgi:peptide/nickel transport system permease protein